MESSRTLIQAHPRPAPADDPPPRGIVPRAERASATARERDGELVLARYRLLERLGAGGFGEVWRAQDEQLQREVAVKRIWLGPDDDGERATREAHASARLAHPAIVRLYEACLLEDAFYLISELVDGDTLAQLIAADALDDREILEIALALAHALAHAHERGVIHRDVKPQNVLVPAPPAGGEPRPELQARSAAKLADFGGASLVGEDALTCTGDVLGTLAYMAPEQLEGRSVDEQADLYSLALVTYEALCGVNPVRGATPADTARRIGRTIEPLRRRRRDLPRELTHALDRALSRSPRERGTLEQLCRAFALALEQCAPGREAPAQPDVARTRHRAASSAPPHPTHDVPRMTPRGPALAPLPAAHADDALAPEDVAPPRRAPALPRSLWLVGALLLVVWQLWDGRAGVALLALAAALALLALPREHASGRLGAGWLACALAPLLGMLGLAGAFPALAGQAPRWRERLAYGALGYWWLMLAGALVDSRAHAIWLAPPAGTPSRARWEGSIDVTAAHVIAPLLSVAVLCGVLLWALAALVLPWIVRGRNAALDIVAATVWSAALLAFSPLVDAGLSAQGADPSPRGAILGAVLGGMLAVAARALRGPV